MSRHHIRILEFTVATAALIASALLVKPDPGTAQERSGPPASSPQAVQALRLDARPGIAIPTADLRDYVDEGPVVGAGVAYRLGERLSIRADWTAALMHPADRKPLRDRGADIPRRGSETDLHHLTGAVQFQLSKPRVADLEVRVHAGAGVTLLSTEETSLAEGGDFTTFTLDAGMELAVPLGGGVQAFGRGDLYVLPLRGGTPSHLLKEVTLPFAGGLSVGL